MSRIESIFKRLVRNPCVKVYLSCLDSEAYEYSKSLKKILNQNSIDTVDLSSTNIALGANWFHLLVDALDSVDVVIIVGSSYSLLTRNKFGELDYILESKRFPIISIFPHGGNVFWGSSRQMKLLANHAVLMENQEAFDSNCPSEEGILGLAHSIENILKKAKKKPISSRSVPDLKLPLNEGKLILVGRGEVGKTSLVKRLTSDEFQADEPITQGICISSWPILCGSEELKLNVWDFGGQEIMHATHQFFLTERSIYLLVLNGREGGEDVDAEYWLKHINTFGGESQVIIVQNKISQHPFELNYRGLKARYPNIRAFVKTDCLKNIGIDELKEKIHGVVDQMPEIRMPFPADWFQVKKQLESMEEDYMGYEGFRTLCNNEGITEAIDQDKLSWIMHCLGIALNYRDDSRLRETSVLKPEWVTQGIYKILNAQELSERQGELHLDDLKPLLDNNRYPVEKHHFLMELMNKFSLCFAFPDQVDRYLIPELLGKEEPEEAQNFSAKESLNFEYEYEVLPEGLIPRFIVRSHTLSHGQERWRTGVILEHEGCKALVKANISSRKVIVRVHGGDSGSRRRLLALVRYDMDRINSEFKDRLNVQQKVPMIDYPEFPIDYKKLIKFESEGLTEFPEFIGNEVVKVPVNELLNGVDFEGQLSHAIDAFTKGKSVFISYSHKDENLKDDLETHLKILVRQGVISTWNDRKILPGQEWDEEIDSHLENAKIILLLVSADFMASDYVNNVEIKRAIEKHESKEATVIPIMLRDCDWTDAPFAKIQGVPKDMKAINTFNPVDPAWTEVAKKIREVADSI